MKSVFTFFEAPAQSEVEYEIKSFTPGREHKTIYQGASKEVDRAWGELYNRKSRSLPKTKVKDHDGFRYSLENPKKRGCTSSQ